MEKGLFQDKTPDERFEMLEATADTKLFFSYERQYSNQEIELFREQLGDILIELDKIEVEKAAAVKDFNEALKPLKIQLKEIVDNVRFRSSMREEMVYKFIDHDANKVNLYTKEGICVSSKPLRFDEMQRSIMSEIRNKEEYRDNNDTEEEEEEDWATVEVEEEPVSNIKKLKHDKVKSN